MVKVAFGASGRLALMCPAVVLALSNFSTALLAQASGPAEISKRVITTLAGTDFVFTGDRGPALQAPINPNAVALDKAGNVYIADGGNNRILMLSPDGIIVTIAGNGIKGYSGDGGPAVSAALQNPHGVAVDNEGRVFFADTDNYRIRVISSSGLISTVAGNGSFGSTGDGGPAVNATLRQPLGIALDALGNLYIADASPDQKDSRVRKVTPSGVISTFAGMGPSGFSGDHGPAVNASLNFPEGVAADSAGNIYIADTFNNRVRKVAADGTITTVAGSGNCGGLVNDGQQAINYPFCLPDVVAVDSADNFYVGAQNQIFRIIGGVSHVFAGSGSSTFSGDGAAAKQAGLRAIGMAINTAGDLYVADYNNVIRLVKAGVITTVAGNRQYRFFGDGGPPVSASLNYPASVAADTFGHVFIADEGNNRIRKIDLQPSPIVTTFAGTGDQSNTTVTGSPGDGGPADKAPVSLLYSQLVTDSAGNLYINSVRVRKVSPDGTITTLPNSIYARGLAIDKSGNLYMSDAETNTVQKLTPAGVRSTYAGSGTAGYCGDNGPATSACLNYPYSLAMDGAGNLFILDLDNYRVRKVTPGGIITTVAGNGNFGAVRDSSSATSVSVSGTTSLAADAEGNLFLADESGFIRLVATDGSITTVVGQPGANQGPSGDGGPAGKATLQYPRGVALDGAGNLYIADVDANRIRVVLASPPSLLSGATQLAFSGVAGGAPPDAQEITVSASIPGVLFTASVDSSASRWLALSTGNGATPRLVDVIADPTNLSAGTYHGTITITAPDALPAVFTVGVTFTVGPGSGPVLSLDQQNLSFAFPKAGTAQSQRIVISNSGDGKMSFNATAATVAGGPWLSVSPGAGSATPGTPAILNVKADPDALAPGTYTGSVTITAAGTAKTIPVTMTISSADSAILLSQRGITFTAVEAGGVVPSQTFSLLNIGSAPVSWTVSSSTLAGGSNWLRVTPGSGSTGLGAASSTTLTVSVDPSGLAPNSYYGLVRIDAPGAANTPQVLTVFLLVLPAGSNISAAVQPAALVFTAVAGGPSPSSQNLMVYNITAVPKSFRSALTGPAAVATLPGDATLDPQQPTPIVVQPFTTGLSPGVYSGTLTLQFSDGRTSGVSINLIVTPAGGVSTSSAKDVSSGACLPSKLQPTLVTLTQSFEVSAGWPVALVALVKDDCGTALTAGSVTVSFSNGDPPIALQSLADGHWENTWQNGSASAHSQVTIKVHAEDPRLGLSGDELIAGGTSAPQEPPLFDLAGVAAVFGGPAYVPLAPGGIISIFGDRLSENIAQSSGLPLTTELATTQVFMAGAKLPLFYVSQHQINAIVPYAINFNAPQYLLVERGLTYSVPVLVSVAPSQPSIFPLITVYPANGGSPFTSQASSPAQVGDTLVVYSTGLGAVTPEISDGTAATGSTQTDHPVQLLIGGKTARVDYSGLAPGFAGLYQVNAVVPSGVASGDAVPVTLTVAGQTSPGVSVAIK